MRRSITTALAGAALATMATPALAQEGNSTRQVLGRILDVILGPDEQAQPDDAAAPVVAPVSMDQVLAAPTRNEDRARDEWRHPAETLGFFRVQPGQTVVDYMPASGWYTRVLVPYLGSQGLYIGLTPDPAAADAERFETYFAGLPGKFREAAPEWGLTGAPMAVYGSQDLPEELNGQVDRVLIFREMHNLLRSGAMYTELSRIRGLLKPDGMVGIVQHRAKESAPAAYTLGGNGYLRETDVIALMRAHGFELVDSSTINANPRDPANWEGGVWVMPPGLSGDDAMDARTRDLGESDRMTLLFRKR
ncbi:class I SAM-dependent methyltransferase [Qipengyuania mesophila]|uniref:class I SAM-dependent methyltransferase n=1 Tax=Qipengyuania mesophila TaxID=2867246 RepID=UPI003514792F